MEKPDFDSHSDVLNSRTDEAHAYVMVMSQATLVPASKHIKFGNNTKYFPFGIFHNCLGCKTSMRMNSNVERRWKMFKHT
eukprot:5775060-Ditylum_brightwellii.AAC.1